MAAPVEVLAPIIYNVKDPCVNPVMLLWLNSLGGFSQWMFERKQVAEVETTLGDIYEEPFFEIETTNRTLRQRDSSYSHGWTLQTEDLTTDEVLALAEMKTTEAVYVMKQDGTTLGVIAEGITTIYNRYSKKHIFSVKINWPRDFNPERWLIS
ncbi:unnamed protein product [marine sediment metagenome]|uniref:Uncharacterized protein n=1 Tax=marine sediment metagenome TaxID=412755 RepID=X0TIV7_9ZZZZ